MAYLGLKEELDKCLGTSCAMPAGLRTSCSSVVFTSTGIVTDAKKRGRDKKGMTLRTKQENSAQEMDKEGNIKKKYPKVQVGKWWKQFKFYILLLCLHTASLDLFF